MKIVNKINFFKKARLDTNAIFAIVIAHVWM
jgi:hypothetical protein